MIIGDIKTANKFYVKVNDSIEWVPSLNLAKKYVENPIYELWYKKDIYATNEDFIVGTDGKTYLKSEYTKKEVKLNIDIIKSTFKTQAKAYIENKLLELSLFYDYDNFYTMISWKNSSIKKFKQEAELALKYRDTVYLYYFKFLEEEIENLVVENDNFDISNIYTKYIENFPNFLKEDITNGK